MFHIPLNLSLLYPYFPTIIQHLKNQWKRNGTDLHNVWLSYIDIVHVLLNTVYVVRSGN